jgi:hypothetical protein
MGVMHTDMNREIPTAAKKPPTINLSHITVISPPLTLNAILVPETRLPIDSLRSKKSPPQSRDGLCQKNNSGGVLLSHAVTQGVSSALPGLTAEFTDGIGCGPGDRPAHL